LLKGRKDGGVYEFPGGGLGQWSIKAALSSCFQGSWRMLACYISALDTAKFVTHKGPFV
jgi:hypothetical protein